MIYHRLTLNLIKNMRIHSFEFDKNAKTCHRTAITHITCHKPQRRETSTIPICQDANTLHLILNLWRNLHLQITV